MYFYFIFLSWCASKVDIACAHIPFLAFTLPKRIVAEARRRFTTFIKDKDVSALPPDLRFPVFEIILRTTQGVEEYMDIVNYYRESFVPAEKVVALSVLGYGSSLELVQRTLAFAMSPEVRTQDILTAIATLRSSVVGRAELWDFMRQHWDMLYERHCDDIGFLDYFVVLSIESFSTLERYQEVQAFFANKDTSAYDRILATCLEGIRMNILWLERDCKDVERWLRDNGYLVDDPSSSASEDVGQIKAVSSGQDGVVAKSLTRQDLSPSTASDGPVNGGGRHGTHSGVGQQLLQLQQDQQEHELRMQREYQLQLQQRGHGHGHGHSHFGRSEPRPRTLEREMELLSMSGDYEF